MADIKLPEKFSLKDQIQAVRQFIWERETFITMKREKRQMPDEVYGLETYKVAALKAAEETLRKQYEREKAAREKLRGGKVD